MTNTQEAAGLHKNRSLKQKVVRATGAVTTAVALYGAGIGTYAAASKSPKAAVGISAKAARQEAVQTALSEQDAYNGAVSAAKDYEDTLNGGGSIGNMPVLNGVIEQQYKGIHKFIPVIKDPIILSTINSHAKHDKKGNFLDGGWIGLQGNDAQGNVTISPVPYDSEQNKFVAYNSKEVVFAHLGVYATKIENEPGVTTGHELIGYDLQGKKEIENPDHTIVSPGLDLVDK